MKRRRQTTVESWVNTMLLLPAHWHCLSLFAVCSKLAGSLDVSFRCDGHRFC